MLNEQRLERTTKEIEILPGRQRNSIKKKIWHQNNPHPMLGRIHNDETRARIAMVLTGRKHSAESVAKRAEKRRMPADREQEILDAYYSVVQPEVKIHKQTGEPCKNQPLPKYKYTFRQLEKLFNTCHTTINQIIDRNGKERR